MNMSGFYQRIAGLLAFLGCALPAPLLAANQHVTVGGTNNVFSPSSLSINVGDTVTFTNAGGFHNVATDNGSWKCSSDCSDTGGTGAASGSAWSFTRTFNTAGTVGYHCEVHQAMGMTGSITVNAVAASGQPIVGGISGNWFNPTPGQGGHGFQFEVLPGNGMLAIWFVFNPDGTQQNWIYSQGSYVDGSNDATLPAFLEQGGAFPPNFDGSKVTAPPWGTLEFKFTDCDHGTAEWTPNATADAAGYHQVAFPIQRLSHILGAACP